jgi:hypothetical protein
MTNNNIFSGTPLLRNSERKDFKECQQKWWWGWEEGWVPKAPLQNAAWFGTCWHLLWAEVYTPPGNDGFVRGISNHSEIHELWDTIMKDAYVKIAAFPYFDEDAERDFVDAQELGHIMINGQLAQWNLDPAWEVIAPEQRFRFNVPFNSRQKEASSKDFWGGFGYPRGPHAGDHIVTVIGTFDLTVFDHASGKRQPKVIDWKTTRDRRTMKSLNKDDQLGTYISVINSFLKSKGLINKDEEVRDFIFSFARKAKPMDGVRDEQGRLRNNPQIKHYKEALTFMSESDFKGINLTQLAAIAAKAGIKVYGEISKNQGAALFWRDIVRRNKANRLRQISRIADDAQVMASVRNGILPITKNPGDHCNWCTFNDVCDIDEDGGDTETFLNDFFKKEDRYADHREGAINSKESVASKKKTGIT